MSEFQNPQQEPGIEKRLILVFVLTFIVIILSQQLLFKKQPQQPAKQPEQQQQQQAAAPPPATIAATPAPGAATSTAAKQATSETETVVESDLYRITFTNKGGLVRSWILKNYKDEQGKPLELVHQTVAPQFGYPLSFWTWDEQLRTKLNTAMYVPSATGAVAPGNDITFEFADGDVTVRKTFKFDHSYVVRMQTSVARGGNYIAAFPAWPGGFGDQVVPASYASSSLDYAVNDKITRLSPKKISGGGTIREPFNWAGIRDQYFAALFLPQDPQSAAMVTLHYAVDVPKNPAKPDNKETVREQVLGAAVGSLNGYTDQRIFVGPMDVDILDQVHSIGTGGAENGPDLKGIVDFGMFGFIARPLFLWLKWTHSHWVANWGWAIVILTVIINLALLPLRIMSMRSALKMQRIAPQIKAVQEKYKKYSMRDPKRAEMNQEISGLYKQHNVNPAGGCLPLLIQMPFLFAFYKMLAIAIELRQAPWLWVRDLAAPDHMMILPIGIVLSTLFVQKMTPQAGMDPAQQRMMTFMMPVFLGFMSWSLAAGLSLYWTVGNVIAIIQQYVMNRTELGREMRETAEKRERKKQLK